MENTKQLEVSYFGPKMEIFDVKATGCLCSSPGGGGSEGTEDEPLF